MADRLEEINKDYRNENLVKNTFNNNDEYNEAHPNAISDGDEHGKEKLGSATDIKTRGSLLIKNKFTENKEYNESTFDKL